MRRAIQHATVLLLAFFSVMYISCSVRRSVDLSIENPLNVQRMNEVIELEVPEDWAKELQQGKNLHIRRNDREFPLQPIDTDRDGLIDAALFRESFYPLEKKDFTFFISGDEALPEKDSLAFAMFVPQRKDDFAWENDRVAFRMYGPALEATGEISSGVDPWCKKVAYPILRKWYAPGVNYHEDHGEGGDFYKVGRSSGVGGSALLLDGKYYFSHNFTDYRIIANGPYRVVFELEYAPLRLAGMSLKETKRIQLDAGSNFNHFSSSFKLLDGKMTPGLSFGAGLPILHHPNALISGNAAMAKLLSWEDLRNDNAYLGTALFSLMSGEHRLFSDEDQYFLLFNSNEALNFSYYAGFAWSKATGITSQEEFEKFIAEEMKKIANPLIIKN